MDEALEVFSDCWAELTRTEISERGMLLAMTFLESAHAYLEYKFGKFEHARSRVLNSMEADLRLERDKDFALLEMHRIQSAQNLMRIDLRAGETKRALSLARQILAYIEGLVDELPVHHSWQGKSFLAMVPRSILRALLAQVANEFVLSLSYFPLDDVKEFLEDLPYEGHRDRSQVINEQFRLWLLAKQAFHQADWDRYLQLLLEFLPTGRTGAQAIWYSTLLDVLALCRELDTQASRLLYEVLLCESRKWRDLPIPFRPLLGLTQSSEWRLSPQLQTAGFSALSDHIA